MNLPLPVTAVVRLDQMVGDDGEDIRLLKLMAEAARNYIDSFSWCQGIRDIWFGDGYGGIVAVFLVRIEPLRAEIDEWLWVVVGDVPPAYLVSDGAKVPSEALAVYVEEMSAWVRLAKEGRSSPDVIPVALPATPANAADLENRLRVLRDVIVPAFVERESG